MSYSNGYLMPRRSRIGAPRTLRHMKIAARYKNNMIPGERPPDALRDSSFKRYLNNAKFVEAARAFR